MSRTEEFRDENEEHEKVEEGEKSEWEMQHGQCAFVVDKAPGEGNENEKMRDKNMIRLRRRGEHAVRPNYAFVVDQVPCVPNARIEASTRWRNHLDQTKNCSGEEREANAKAAEDPQF